MGGRRAPGDLRALPPGTTSDGTEVSGLGLNVARRHLREQGGDLWLIDRAGGGASFVLSLPPD